MMGSSDTLISRTGTKEMSTGYDLTERIVLQPQAQPEAPPVFLRKIAQRLEAKAFNPHPMFTSGHAQTLAAYHWPRRFRMRNHRRDEARIFEVEPGVCLLAHCRWQEERLSHPTVLLAHGLEGSTASVYMLGTAEKAYGAGFNVVRLNFRTCGQTEDMTPTLYHGGLISDLRAVVRELIEEDNLSRIFMIGFSLGGNMSLMFAGDDGGRVPEELKGICAISPTIDLQSCQEAIERRANWLYMQSFVRSMRQRIRRKRKFFPERYDTKGLRRLRKIRDFDERYTIVEGGYSSVEEYYERASSIRVLGQIRTPALMIHAQDDPFVPFDPFRHPSIAGNPYLIFLAPEHGGHVGFLGATADGEDRFWVENRAVEFCQLVNEHLPS
jgi:predicted alpha/beta-fold hydrolase